MGDRTVTAADVEAIATLPSREELQARLLRDARFANGADPIGPLRSIALDGLFAQRSCRAAGAGSGRQLELYWRCPTGRFIPNVAC